MSILGRSLEDRYLQPGRGRTFGTTVSLVHPYLVPMPDGSFRMYYLGVGALDGESSQYGIGLAVSDGKDFRKWKRWGE